MSPPTSRLRGLPLRQEDGFVAGSEALLLGVLVLVFGSLVTLGGWAVIDTTFATSAAAREAVRAAVEAPIDADLATAGQQAAAVALDAHGVAPERATIRMVSGRQERCAEVAFEVSVPVRLPVVPALGGRPATMPVSSTYAEVVDPFRSGLPAGGACGF